MRASCRRKVSFGGARARWELLRLRPRGRVFRSRHNGLYGGVEQKFIELIANVPSSVARSRNGGKAMVKELCGVSDFMRRLRVQVRFGRLSRSPLRLLRLELRGKFAECEWVARAPDQWDAGLPQHIGERNASLQALEDSLAVRDLLFCALPNLSSALFRVYRQTIHARLELIVIGTVDREEASVQSESLVMRAKLSGLRFSMADGHLEAMQFAPAESELATKL